jgi:arginyl-tRNA synthetase
MKLSERGTPCVVADGRHLEAPSQRVPSVRAEIATAFSAALRTAFPTVDIQPAVAATNNPDHGDYQCNNAMALFGRMKGKASPTQHPDQSAHRIFSQTMG